jgi:predicted Fe-S protein YdhL (DUF1289 family)
VSDARESSNAEPASPCVDVCVLDEDGEFCLGCRRTLDEIASWPTLTTDEKRAVLKALRAR